MLESVSLTFATRGQRKAWKLLSWLLLQEGKERLESFSVDFHYKRARKGLKASQLTFATRGQRKAWKLLSRLSLQEGKIRLECFSVDFHYKRAKKGLKASQSAFATRGQRKAWKLLSWLSLLTLRTTAWASKPLKGKERLKSFSFDFRYKRAKKGLKASQLTFATRGQRKAWKLLSWLSLLTLRTTAWASKPLKGKERIESSSVDFRYKRVKKGLKASHLTFATRGQRKAWKLLSWLSLQGGKERLESFSVDFRYKRAKKGLKASQMTFATRGQRKVWKLLSWLSLLTLRTTAWASKPLKGKERIESSSVDFRYKRVKKGLKASHLTFATRGQRKAWKLLSWLSLQGGKERLESFSVDFRYKRAKKGLKASQMTFATRGQRKAWKLLSWLSLLTLTTTSWASKTLKGKERLESFLVDFRYKKVKKGLKASQLTFPTRG